MNFKELQRLAKEIPKYVIDVISLMTNPRRFLRKMLEAPTESIQHGILFLLISIIITLIITPSFLRPKDIILGTIWHISFAILGCMIWSLCTYISWVIVRKHIDYIEILIVGMFANGFIALIGIAFVSIALGYMMVENYSLTETLYINRLIHPFYIDQKLLDKFSLFALSMHDLFSLIGIIFSTVWYIIIWRVFTELSQAGRVRSFFAYIISGFLYILMSLFIVPMNISTNPVISSILSNKIW